MKDMKKTIIYLLLFLTTTVVFAQKEHMTFIGIPLDGGIEQFRKQIEKKGFTVDENILGVCPEGSMPFKGVFAGHESKAYVYFASKPSVVYRSKAVIHIPNKDAAINLYNTLSAMIAEKYSHYCTLDTVLYGFDSRTYMISECENPDCDPEKSIGSIDLYVTDSSFGTDISYSVNIDYIDRKNHNKYLSTIAEDL